MRFGPLGFLVVDDDSGDDADAFVHRRTDAAALDVDSCDEEKHETDNLRMIMITMMMMVVMMMLMAIIMLVITTG